MSLGDYFPQDLRDDFARKGISYGSALLVKIPEFKLNYRKYVILLNRDKERRIISYVTINTNKGIEDLSVKIKCSEYDFLQYDSWIDCSKLLQEKIRVLINYIKDNPDKVLGNIDDNTLEKIDRRIKSSPTISKKEKEKFNFI